MRKYLYCEPLFDELKCSFRFSWLLQEELRKEGIGLKRFSYRGCGEADGDFCDIEMESILDDICKNSVGAKGVIGLRFGAMAAVMAKLKQVEKFILVCPIIDGKRYVEELAMSQRIRDLMTSKEKLPGECQYLNFEGYEISKNFISQIKGVDITENLRKMNAKATIICNQNDVRLKNKFSDCENVKFAEKDFAKIWQRVGAANYNGLIEEIKRQCNG